MSAYRVEDERAIRMQRRVRDWTKSGLLSEEQRERMMPELQVDLRRTNLFLRATLFVFGFLIVMAIAGLTLLMVDLRRDFWVLAAVLAAAAFTAALQSVRRFRLYRFGIEEAFAVASVVFAGLATGGFADAIGLRNDFPMSAAFAGAAAIAFAAFQYFGFVYAAIISMVCAAAIPLQFIDDDMTRRSIAVALILAVFVAARRARTEYDDEYPGDGYAIIEAAAWVASYLLINLKLSPWIAQPDGTQTTFYWVTYGATWLWPAIGLWLAIRDRHRWMLDVSIAMALATLMTNKEYLGTPRYAYDPIAFGLLLIAIAIGLRRWLGSGEGEARSGFTARRLLASEHERLAAAGTASVLAPGAPAPQAETDPGIGGGGRSGGAGAGGSF